MPILIMGRGAFHPCLARPFPRSIPPSVKFQKKSPTNRVSLTPFNRVNASRKSLLLLSPSRNQTARAASFYRNPLAVKK